MIGPTEENSDSKSVEMIGEGPAQTKGIGIDTYVIERKRLGAS